MVFVYLAKILTYMNNLGEIELQQLITDLAQELSQLANSEESGRTWLCRAATCHRVGMRGIFGDRY